MLPRLTVLFLLVASTTLASDGPVIVETRLTPQGFVSIFATDQGLETSIPRIRIYSASGLELAEMTGYMEEMPEFINATLVDMPKPGARKLADLLPLMTKLDGTPLKRADLLRNERAVLTFGAEWCAPCRALKTELKKIDGIYIIEVDADDKHIGADRILKAWAERTPQH